MAIDRWNTLYDSMAFSRPVQPRHLGPLKNEMQPFLSSEADIEQFEGESGIKLPHSYCEFVSQFGPGYLSDRYWIAAPGFAQQRGRKFADTYDLKDFNYSVHTTKNEVDAYSPDPSRRRRFLFFAGDQATAFYAWDPSDVTDAEEVEYGIYVEYREWDIVRLADSFLEFTTEVLLGPRHTVLCTDPPPELTYQRP